MSLTLRPVFFDDRPKGVFIVALAACFMLAGADVARAQQPAAAPAAAPPTQEAPPAMAGAGQPIVLSPMSGLSTMDIGGPAPQPGQSAADELMAQPQAPAPASDPEIVNPGDIPSAQTQAGATVVEIPGSTPAAPDLSVNIQQAAPAQTATPQASAPAASGVPDAAPQIDENVFFDADSLVPEGEMGAKTGPQRVNPVTQPASKFVVVRNDHDSGTREAQLVSARRAVQFGRYDSALGFYDKMLEKNPSDTDALLGKAIALQHAGQVDQAIDLYEKILDQRPGNVEARVNMLGLVGKRYPAVAIAQLSDLVKSNPNNENVFAQLGVVQASVGRYNDALQSLGVAIALDPRNANHFLNIAVIADRAGRKTEAVKYYEQALEVDTMYGGGRSIPRESVYDRLANLR